MPTASTRPGFHVVTLATLIALGSFGRSASAAPPASAPPEGPVQADGEVGDAVPGPDGVDETREVDDYADPFAVALAPVAGGLTSGEVAERAVATAPAIAVAQADLEAAAAQVDQTVIQFLPQLKGEASYTRLSPVRIDFGDGATVGVSTPGPITTAPCPPGSGLPMGSECVVDAAGNPAGAAAFDFPIPLNNFSLKASLGVPISDYVLRLVPGIRAAKHAARSAETFRKAEQLKVQTDAKVAYYNWVKAIAMKTVAEQSLGRSRARLADAEAQFAAGTVNKADVMRLDATVAQTESTLVDAEAFVDVAAANIATIMGEPSTPTYAIGEDVLGPVPELADVRPLDDMVSEAMSQRYELRSLEANAEAVDYAFRANRANYFPRIDAFANAEYANPNQRFFPQQDEWNGSWAVGVSLTWIVNDTVFAVKKGKELRANQRKVEAQVEQLRRGIRLEVTQAYKDRQRAMRAIQLNERALASAEEAYRVAVDLYRYGNATTTDVLNAELGLVNATLDDISARIDARIANAKLTYASGRTRVEAPTDAR